MPMQRYLADPPPFMFASSSNYTSAIFAGSQASLHQAALNAREQYRIQSVARSKAATKIHERVCQLCMLFRGFSNGNQESRDHIPAQLFAQIQENRKRSTPPTSCNSRKLTAFRRLFPRLVQFRSSSAEPL